MGEFSKCSTEIQRLCEQIARYPEVGVAYLARKVATGLPDKPLYLLGVLPKRPWYQLETETINQKLAERIAAEVQFAEPIRVIVLSSDVRWLRKRFRSLPGAEIYRR